jgi:hypothetical protein
MSLVEGMLQLRASQLAPTAARPNRQNGTNCGPILSIAKRGPPRDSRRSRSLAATKSFHFVHRDRFFALIDSLQTLGAARLATSLRRGAKTKWKNPRAPDVTVRRRSTCDRQNGDCRNAADRPRSRCLPSSRSVFLKYSAPLRLCAPCLQPAAVTPSTLTTPTAPSRSCHAS